MIYESIDNMPDRRIAFITTDSEGLILSSTVSKTAVSTNRTGNTLIVDDYVADQITKFRFINGELILIDEEKIIVPVKTEKELQIEAIERQLAALKAEPDEPADIEENTDVPLLNYTEQPSE